MQAGDIAIKLLKVLCDGACSGAIASTDILEDKLGDEIVKGIGAAAAKVLVLEPTIGLFAVWAAKKGFPLLRGLKSAEQRAALDAIANMTPQQALEASREVLREAKLAPAAKAAVEGYVLSIPHAVRRGTTRFNDGGVSATFLSQVPRSLAEFQGMLPLRPPLFRPETRLAGHDYALKELLGQGGYGEVWKAEHTVLPAMPPLAIKFFVGELSKESLQNETKVVSAMQSGGGHDNLVALRDTNVTHEPPYVMYEYVAGGDLVGWLAAYDKQVPPPNKVQAMLYQIALGLSFAHAKGVVHRDIKPGNVLVSPDGMVKIADFGIGALTQVAPAPGTDAKAAPDGELGSLGSAGTPAYLDRERDDDKPDPAEDVFALGVLGVQLLVGDLNRTPPLSWRGDLAEKGVDPRFIEMLQTCLDRRARRYKNGAEVAAAIAKIGIPREGKAEPPKSEPPLSDAETSKKKRWLSRSRVKRAARRVVEDVSTIGRSTMSLFELKKAVADVPAAAPVSAPPAPRKWHTLQDHPDAPALVVVPPGRFLMGAPPEEPMRLAAEGPVHEVEIRYPLAVGKGPVTFAEWDAAAKAIGYRPNDAGWGRGHRPVVNVSWDDAQRYIGWLRQLTGKPYSLLTEAEWEYACRGGTLTPYWTGKSIRWLHANFKDAEDSSADEGVVQAIAAPLLRTLKAASLKRARTTPVGQYLPNPLGLHDTHGNVWEWVYDGWHPTYEGAPADGTAWEGGETVTRVLRGGSWNSAASALRAAHRHRRDHRHRSDQVGFRIARVVTAGENVE